MQDRNQILILIPVYDDWEAAALLLECLDDSLQRDGVKVLFVDDASRTRARRLTSSFKHISEVCVLELKRNVGHQRAIVLGLAYVAENINCEAVVVMDADGEDMPCDVPKLIEKCACEQYRKMVFARRVKRSEGWKFKLFYKSYRGLYRLCTGHSIMVGNFSIVPLPIVRRLVAVSEVWNHYAVGALKARVPTIELPTVRGERLAGESGMSFVSLVTHGLSAVSVYSETVSVRLLIAALFLILLAAAGIMAALTIRFTTDLAIPGWTSEVVGILTIILMQSMGFALLFVFIVLNGRSGNNFLPIRDYPYFIERVSNLYPTA